MIDLSLKILKKIEKEGEVKLSVISSLLPKIYGDHRDFYPFASLITQGLVEDSLVKKDEPDKNPEYTSLKLQVLAWKLFATSSGDYKATYKGVTWSCKEKLSDHLYSLTGKGYLYLNEDRSKKFEKRFTFLIAIFSAIFASTVTYF